MNYFKIPKDEFSQKFVEDLPLEYWKVTNKGTMYDVGFNDPSELFDLATDIARERYKEKPEQFTLPNKWVPFLRRAIEAYQKDSMLKVDSIKFKEGVNETTITVYPTQGHSLFAIYTKYGKLVSGTETK